MKKDSLLKSPQLLTKSQTSLDCEIQIFVTDDDGPKIKGVHNYRSKNEFGWVFPDVTNLETGKHVIDVNWLNDYNEEIDNLQIAIKKERSLSFNLDSGNLLERRESSEGGKSLDGNKSLEVSLRSLQTFEREHPQQNAVTNATTNKEVVKTDNIFLSVNNEELLSSTAIADVFCSIRSCPSRDSGISASDDVSDILPEIQVNSSILDELEIPEIQVDRSLLEELEGVSENEHSDTSSDDGAVSTLNKRPCERIPGALQTNSNLKCPVWYKKYSVGETDLILNFNNLNWGIEGESDEEEELDHFTYAKEEAYDSLLTRSDKESSSGDFENHVEETVNNRRRQSLKELWSVCDKLEASSLRSGPSVTKGVSEIVDLVASLSKIHNRLELLKCDLQDLKRQSTESRLDFDGLQKKASNFLVSTETSRHHLTQLVCLERLQERLQEEWWIVHYPELADDDENFIV